MTRIYLAGPITGLSFGEASEWRNEIKTRLREYGDRFEIIDPMRFEKIQEFDVWKTIPMRNIKDVERSDILLVNFTGAKRLSVGTIAELSWAYLFRIPSVVIMDEIHDHPYIKEFATFQAESVKRALQLIERMFS